jgi:hypothetical protein
MTPQERELLSNLTERLRNAPPQKRDPEAEQAIAALLRERPDAPYLLSQTVLVQDYALHQAQARIAELERQQAEPAEPETGSFLGSLLGRSQPAARRPVAAPMAPPAAAAGPWGSAAPGPFAQGGGGSSFLRSAATTAAGVAGGALLFQGIESLLGLGHGGFGGFANAAGLGSQPGLSETVINNYYEDPAAVHAGAQDANIPDFTSGTGGDILDAGYDPGSSDSGDLGGGDFGDDSGSTDV